MICYDATHKQWVGGANGSRLRIAQLKTIMDECKKAHDAATIKQQELIDKSGGTIKGAVAGRNSEALTCFYEYQRELREVEAVLREEEPTPEEL